MKKLAIGSCMLLIVSLGLQAQTINVKKLSKKWKLKKYEFAGIGYHPEKDELGDYIWFKENMQYESVSKNKKETGHWKLGANGNYLLMYDGKNQLVKVFIKKLSAKSLILKFNVKEIKDLWIHYESTD